MRINPQEKLASVPPDPFLEEVPELDEDFDSDLDDMIFYDYYEDEDADDSEG